jgi:hypothetical protein
MPSSRVTDDMVERACREFYSRSWDELVPDTQRAHRARMKEILCAALAEPEGELRASLGRLVAEYPAAPLDSSDASQGYATGWNAAIERVMHRLRGKP